MIITGRKHASHAPHTEGDPDLQVGALPLPLLAHRSTGGLMQCPQGEGGYRCMHAAQEGLMPCSQGGYRCMHAAQEALMLYQVPPSPPSLPHTHQHRPAGLQRCHIEAWGVLAQVLALSVLEARAKQAGPILASSPHMFWQVRCPPMRPGKHLLLCPDTRV